MLSIPFQVYAPMNVDARVNIVEDCVKVGATTSHEMEHIHNNLDQVE